MELVLTISAFQETMRAEGSHKSLSSIKNKRERPEVLVLCPLLPRCTYDQLKRKRKRF